MAKVLIFFWDLKTISKEIGHPNDEKFIFFWMVSLEKIKHKICASGILEHYITYNFTLIGSCGCGGP